MNQFEDTKDRQIASNRDLKDSDAPSAVVCSETAQSWPSPISIDSTESLFPANEDRGRAKDPNLKPTKVALSILKQRLCMLREKNSIFLDSEFVRKSSAILLYSGLGLYIFGQYGQEGVFNGIVPKVPYITDNFGNFGLSALGQAYGVLLGWFISTKSKTSSIFEKIKRSWIFKNSAELTAATVCGFMVLGETMLPQLMGSHYADPKDIPAALLGVVVGYLSIGREYKRTIIKHEKAKKPNYSDS
ncbi:MAG: hypothetical protein R3A13_01980 [Bdellovibrionota bacterium]